MTETFSAVERHPRLAERAAYRHWSGEQVRWSDTDLVGHVNNLSFAAYCETGRCLFLRHWFTAGAAQRLVMLPVQSVVNFYTEAHWPEQVDIGTAVLSVGNTSYRLGHGLFVGERCIGTSESTMVLIDAGSRKPRPLTEELREWLLENTLIV